jgi:hypothetical protein
MTADPEIILERHGNKEETQRSRQGPGDFKNPWHKKGVRSIRAVARILFREIEASSFRF